MLEEYNIGLKGNLNTGPVLRTVARWFDQLLVDKQGPGLKAENGSSQRLLSLLLRSPIILSQAVRTVDLKRIDVRLIS